MIGNATRRALVRIVDLCLNEQVDALVLAGDLYDGEQTSMKTARFLAEQIRRLDGAGIRVFIIRGNHDALSKITKELTFPDTVKVFGGRAEAIELVRERGEVPIVIHGLSFAQAHAPESLLGKYRPPLDGAVNIGIMHTSLGGAMGHDPYAPCGPADLHASGFRYWALGHIHHRDVIEGASMIVMPGMPQGRDINEAGPKSVSLVTIGDDRSIRVEKRVTSVAQFERVTADVSGIADWRDLVTATSGALERARSDVASEHLVARLTLKGTTPLAWRLRRDLDLLGAEMDDRASIIGRCWVEKIEIQCRPPDAVGPSSDPLLELRRLIDEEIIGSEAYGQKLVDIAEELLGQLPSDCRNIFGGDKATLRTRVGDLAREGAQDVLARLHAAPAGADD